MGFNVKAALLVSLAFIGGMAWLIHHVGAPVVALPSPLVAPGNGGTPPIPTAPPARPDALAYDSPLDRQETENRANHDALVLGNDTGEPGTLPPLVLPQPDGGIGPAALTESDVAAGHTISNELRAASGVARDEPLSPHAARSGGDGTRSPVVTAGAPVGQSAGDVGTSPTSPELPKPTLPPKRYVVQSGDSVAKIVRTHWNSTDQKLIRAFVEANPQIRARQNRIFVGEELTIPEPPGPRVAATDGGSLASPPAREREQGLRPSKQPAVRKQPADAPRPRRDPPVAPRSAKPQQPAIAQQPAPRSGLRPVSSEPDAMQLGGVGPTANGGARMLQSSPLGATIDRRVAGAARPEKAPARPAERTVKKITGPMARKLAEAQTAPPRWYTIQRNDSLRTIARRLLKDERRWREIAAMNPSLRDADRLETGRRIKLPAVRIASR